MENIHIQNKIVFENKLKKLKADGLDKLHVVSDFDRTLTKCFLNGKPNPSSFGLIREGGYLTKDYPKKAFALFDKYHPIEIDESLPFDFRFKQMKEWWEVHEKLLVSSGMKKSVVDDIVNKQQKVFREGALDFIDFLSKQKIPLLIFSSGIGNFIEEYLKKENRLFDNIHILSNTFDFDDNGRATGFRDKIIHILNKSEIEIKHKSYLSQIVQRENVLLLGDSIGDLGMSSGIDHKNILKIGFLNEEVENRLEIFKQSFDVVITNDGSMDYVNKLLNSLLIV